MLVSDSVKKIDEIRDRWYKPPRNYYKIKNIDFTYQSYKRSAIEEIKIYLSKHPAQNPIDVLEKFRHIVDHFACRTTSGSASFMFSVYYDVTTDIIDALLE